MNFFYEDFPTTVVVNGHALRIITDFRDYIRLIDMLKNEELIFEEKCYYIGQYFIDKVTVNEESIKSLTQFVSMEEVETCGMSVASEPQRTLFSFEIDYPYILSGFMQDYSIDIQTVKYMHWWKFRMLFDGLSDNTEIKQRMMYRGIDISEIKDKDEKRRIRKIQRLIQLPESKLTDYDIGNAFF